MKTQKEIVCVRWGDRSKLVYVLRKIELSDVVEIKKGLIQRLMPSSLLGISVGHSNQCPIVGPFIRSTDTMRRELHGHTQHEA